MILAGDLEFHSGDLRRDHIRRCKERTYGEAAQRSARTADDYSNGFVVGEEVFAAYAEIKYGNGKGQKTHLITEANAFFVYELVVQKQHERYGGKGAGVHNCPVGCTEIHNAGNKCVLRGKEHLQSEVRAGVGQKPAEKQLIFDSCLKAVRKLNSCLGEIVLALAVLFALFDDKQGNKHGEHNGRCQHNQLFDVYAAADKHGDKGVYKAVAYGVEKGFEAAHSGALLFVLAYAGKASVKGNERQGIGGKEHQKHSAHPYGVDQAVFAPYKGSPCKHIACHHGDKGDDDGGASAPPFGSQIVRKGSERDVHQTVENLSYHPQHAENGGHNETVAGKAPGVNIGGKSRGIHRVGEISAQQHHKEVGAEAAGGIKKFFPLFVEGCHKKYFLSLFATYMSQKSISHYDARCQ